LAVKVIYVLDFLSYGGVERLSYDYLRNLNSERFEVKLLILKGGAFKEEFEQLPVPLTEISDEHDGVLKQLLRIRKFLKRENPDIIHTHNIKGSSYMTLITIGMKVKLIRSFHHFGTLDRLHNKANILTMNRAKANLFVSESFKVDLRKKYGLKKMPRNHIVYNGVDFNRFDGAASGQLREEIGAGENDLVIGMIGNFVRMKDQLSLCKAFRNAQELFPHLQLVFVGTHDGVNLHFLNDCVEFCAQSKISKRVHFLGSRDDIPQILNDLDLFVFSSLGDTFGIALVEAMGMGVPTIATDLGPIKEITHDGSYSAIFKQKDVDDLSAKMIDLIGNDKKRNDLALRAEAFVRSSYDIQSHIDRTLSVYEQVLDL
jgi:glycosyltransferase involved in cell wall biosynthesis